MAKKIHKLLAVLLAGSVTMSVASTAALAVDYDISSGAVHVEADESGTKSWQDGHDTYNSKENGSTDKEITITQSNPETATSNTVNVGENVSDVTITLKDVNIQAKDGESAVTIGAGASANITVSGENTLVGGTNGAGIAVPGKVVLDDTVPDEAEPGDAVLNLSSDKAGGTLTAIGNGGVNTETTSGAGIGGTASQGTSGIINIEGLKGLTAEGYGIHASGIGSALDGDSGAITITDSTIDKVAGGYEESQIKTKYGNNDPEGGAAIGGGGKGGTCGDITITDSTISSAHGGSKATAIGGSCWADAGNITITNSTLDDVVGGSSSAGIGVGRVNRGSADADANITIRNSTVNVTGGEYGAGIGTGYNGDSVGNKNQDDKLASTKITIENSNVTAIGGNGGAAIGGGYKGWNTDITIKGKSEVKAIGGVLSDKKIRTENGASAIGTGANGSGKFEGGKITIDGNAKVIAVSNGGKWAIDLTCDVSSVAFGYQNMFLSDGSETTYSGEQVKNPVDVCETVPYKNEYVVYMNGQKIVLPANFLCAAVTTGGADGVFHTTNKDGTWYFSHYGTVGSDSEEDRAAYGKADTVEKLGTVTVEMTVTGNLAANSYLHVALRAGGEVPEVPEENPGGNPGENPGGNPGENPGGDPGENQGGDPGENPGGNPDKTPDTDPEETEITDPEVPMIDLPSEEIPDEVTPGEEIIDPDVPTTDIPDEDVPQSDVPKTGDMAALWLALSALSGTGLAGVSILGRKKRDEE